MNINMDNVILGLQLTVLGMAVVFFVFIILMGSIKVLTKVSSWLDEKGW